MEENDDDDESSKEEPVGYQILHHQVRAIAFQETCHYLYLILSAEI